MLGRAVNSGRPRASGRRAGSKIPQLDPSYVSRRSFSPAFCLPARSLKRRPTRRDTCVRVVRPPTHGASQEAVRFPLSNCNDHNGNQTMHSRRQLFAMPEVSRFFRRDVPNPPTRSRRAWSRSSKTLPLSRARCVPRVALSCQIGRYSAGTGTFCNDRRELRVTSSLGFRLDRLRYLFAATIVVNCALRLLSASALTVCATYSLAAIHDKRIALYLSGLKRPDDVERIARTRAHAALVGETLMREDDPRPRLVALVQATRTLP